MKKKSFYKALFILVSFKILVMFAVAKRELRSLFLSPIAYVIAGIFTLILSWFFLNIIGFYIIISLQALRIPFLEERINMHDLVVRPFFGNMSIVMLFVIPMLTMRSFAEEKKLGTFELIYTSPIRTSEVVLGKFLGYALFLVFLLVLTLAHTVPLFKFGEPDPGIIISSYIGIFLMGIAFISAGIFASSMTENQIISIIVSFGILLLFWVLGWAKHTMEGELKDLLAYLSFSDHFQSFSQGVIDTRDVVYYLSFTAVMLFFTHMSLESRRWSGA